MNEAKNISGAAIAVLEPLIEYEYEVSAPWKADMLNSLATTAQIWGISYTVGGGGTSRGLRTSYYYYPVDGRDVMVLVRGSIFFLLFVFSTLFMSSSH